MEGVEKVRDKKEGVFVDIDRLRDAHMTREETRYAPVSLYLQVLGQF